MRAENVPQGVAQWRWCTTTVTQAWRGSFFYEDDVWEALGKELKGNPVAVRILGGRLEQSSLVSLNFVLRDGRGLRTKDDYEALKQQCKRLA